MQIQLQQEQIEMQMQMHHEQLKVQQMRVEKQETIHTHLSEVFYFLFSLEAFILALVCKVIILLVQRLFLALMLSTILFLFLLSFRKITRIAKFLSASDF